MKCHTYLLVYSLVILKKQCTADIVHDIAKELASKNENNITISPEQLDITKQIWENINNAGMPMSRRLNRIKNLIIILIQMRSGADLSAAQTAWVRDLEWTMQEIVYDPRIYGVSKETVTQIYEDELRKYPVPLVLQWHKIKAEIAEDAKCIPGSKFSEGNCHKIFLIDGYDKVFEIFNYETKQLTKGPDPPEWRELATVAYYKNKLYYIGGKDSNNHYFAHVNILVNGRWQQGSDLPIGVTFASHVICNDKLYIISKNAVFRLLNDERKWIEVGKMKRKRWQSAVASLNEKIYITGGIYNGEILNSCLCFDPSQPFDRRFTPIASMNYKREDHSLVVANGKLYAIGGRTKEDDIFCKSVEEYDPTTNQWRIVGEIK